MGKIVVINYVIVGTTAAFVLTIAAAMAYDSESSTDNLSQMIAEKSANSDKGGKTFSGQVSWYGAQFEGRKTASGEIFHMNRLSAAHKTLPMPTRVLVENPRNGRSAMVRVNDRGPYVHGRVMDLSREAARRVGIFPGVGYVEATIIDPDDK